MPFDWFTIVAQIINFVVLLWLLRRFLFRPILHGLDAREQRLKKVLLQAEEKKADALRLEKSYQLKQQELAQQCSLILKNAQDEASQTRQHLFNSAQEAADQMLSKRLESIQHELQYLQQQIIMKSIKEVYATVEKILHDLSGIPLQQAMLDKFLIQLTTLQAEQREQLHSALQRANYHVVVRSALVLTDEFKEEIRQVLETLSDSNKKTTLTFDQNPQLITGLELSVGGWKLAWSAHHYLETLENRLQDAVQLTALKLDAGHESTI